MNVLERWLVQLLVSLPPWVQVALSGGRAVRADGDVLDPGLQLLLWAQARRGMGGMLAQSVEHARAGMARIRLLTGPPTPVAGVRDVEVAGAAGPLRARLYTTHDGSGERQPLLVYLHGGGWVLGDLDSHDEECRVLCRFAGVHVLSVDYRLAPEHPFPAGVEDARAAFAWARSHAGELGADPSRIGIGGDSAGGNLAAVVAQQLRGEDGAPAAQVLVYPAVDASRRYPSREKFGHGLLLTDEDMTRFEELYSGGLAAQDPRRSPLLTEDLTGLAPTILVTAAFDPLRDEGEAYVARLRESGVPVVAWRAPGLVHGFLNLSSLHRASRDAVLHLAGAVRVALHGQVAGGSAAARGRGDDGLVA